MGEKSDEEAPGGRGGKCWRAQDGTTAENEKWPERRYKFRLVIVEGSNWKEKRQEIVAQFGWMKKNIKALARQCDWIVIYEILSIIINVRRGYL